jgi:hypothetical protein
LMIALAVVASSFKEDTVDEAKTTETVLAQGM